MFKTTTISFRTKQELMESLDRISRESGCSRSALIETILRAFLAGKQEDRLRFENRDEAKGALPAASGPESAEGITYISVGGVSVGVPRDLRCQVVFDKEKGAFRLSLSSGIENSAEIQAPSGQNKIVVWNTSGKIGESEQKGSATRGPENENMPFSVVPNAGLEKGAPRG